MKKILVVQYRTDGSKEHDQQCFIEASGYPAERFHFVSAIENEFPKSLDDYAGVILGGSGEFWISQGDGEGTWMDWSYDFITKVLEENVPLFGVCFGYQLLALHQGAKIVHDESMQETGAFDTTLLEESKNDPIFSKFPQIFDAQYGHKDTIVDFTENMIPLARTEKVPMNSFRLEGKDAWGILFHPELNKSRLVYRVEKFFPNYANGQDLDELFKDFKDCPDAEKFLTYFIEFALNN